VTCNHEAPSVEAASVQWGDEVAFVGVAWQGSVERMQGFIDEHGLTFPTINDDPAVIFERFEVPYQPAWVFVAADGTLRQVLGSLEGAELDEILRTMTEGV
jgi:peroxiredoxin